MHQVASLHAAVPEFKGVIAWGERALRSDRLAAQAGRR
jgi:hypothetical protein